MRTEPASSGVRFRVENVYSIMGEGCMVAGIVESGTVRPPVQLRIEPGPSSPSEARVIDVVKVVVRRRPTVEVGVGEKAGFTLRGLPGGLILPGSIRRDWEIRAGDYLVSL